MTMDDVIAMAKQAELPAGYDDKLAIFAALVEERAVAAEREACAQVCDHYATALDGGDNHYLRSSECRQAARKIRARGTA